MFVMILFFGCNPVLDPIGDRAVEEGETLELTVSATAPGGQIPSLSAENLPPGALFTDNGDGTGIMLYTAPMGPSLVFEDVIFTASTDKGVDSESIHIFVDDTDHGGYRVRFFHQGKEGQHGIAMDEDGVLYLADFQFTVWKVFQGRQSRFVAIWGTPSGLALDPERRLFVSATNGAGIWRVMANGTKELFSAVPNPWELGFDSMGNLYAATHGGDIYVIDPDGVASVFASGFTTPFGVAVDSSDTVYITEHTLGNIYAIGPGGEAELFASGLTNPEGLAIDANDNLFVADTADGILLRIDPSGVQTIVASGMSYPVSMAFGPDGRLYLACAGSSGRVYVLTPNP